MLPPQSVAAVKGLHQNERILRYSGLTHDTKKKTPRRPVNSHREVLVRLKGLEPTR